MTLAWSGDHIGGWRVAGLFVSPTANTSQARGWDAGAGWTGPPRERLRSTGAG